MFSPKYRAFITCESFPGDEFICLGTQLITIANSIKDFLPQHMWYGADVDTFGRGAVDYNVDGIQLNLIGTDAQFIEFCSGIGQFIWGDFLCIDSSFSSQNLQGIELETEDLSFRSIDCDGVLMEIKAFDTTFFQVYSEDIEIMKEFSRIYKVEIEQSVHK